MSEPNRIETSANFQDNKYNLNSQSNTDSHEFSLNSLFLKLNFFLLFLATKIKTHNPGFLAI